MSIDLSVILISKNQGWNIERLIGSVIDELASLPSAEVVLVDSASTDDTVERARRYPISIVRLPTDATLTPAAGRYIGYRQTTGRYVLFLDGDMECYAGWLARGCAILDRQPEAAVVTGQLVDLPPSAGPDDKRPLGELASNEAVEVPYCGGAGLYRRSVLEEVGTFNPFLHSDEEPELCIRIRHRGYKVLRLNNPIAYHYSSPSDVLGTLVGRWRRKLYLGAGQNIRYHLHDDLLWPYVRERGFGIVPALAVLVGLGLLAWSAAFRTTGLFRLYLLACLTVLTVDAARKRSLYRTVYSLLQRVFIVDGTLRGFLMAPYDPSSYSVAVEVLQHPIRLERARADR